MFGVLSGCSYGTTLTDSKAAAISTFEIKSRIGHDWPEGFTTNSQQKQNYTSVGSRAQ